MQAAHQAGADHGRVGAHQHYIGDNAAEGEPVDPLLAEEPSEDGGKETTDQADVGFP